MTPCPALCIPIYKFIVQVHGVSHFNMYKDVEEDLDSLYSEQFVLNYQKEKDLSNPATFNMYNVRKEQLTKWLASITRILYFQKELVKARASDQLSSVKATVQST